LAPGNPQAHYNRGVIFEKRGKRAEAIAAYQTALRHKPGYKPAKTRLTALGVQTSAGGSMTPTQQRAWQMAVHAKELAQRGNYEAAMRELDEAVRLAPNLGPIHHYRYTVAYLMGDIVMARAELERALALNPDDAFAQRNLERLKAKQAGAEAAPLDRNPTP
jgi:tetratricopeptide (TPR) repeat protein